jgi:hypothetical protein
MKVLALAGMLALGSVATTTVASARGMGHAMGMSHSIGMSHSMGMGHPMSMGHPGFGHAGHFHPFFHHRRFVAFGFGLGYPYDADYGYDDCWRPRHVLTRWGWRWRTVNVCGYY